MLRFRRRNARTVVKLARVLAALDEQLRLTHPARKRAARASFPL